MRPTRMAEAEPQIENITAAAADHFKQRQRTVPLRQLEINGPARPQGTKTRQIRPGSEQPVHRNGIGSGKSEFPFSVRQGITTQPVNNTAPLVFLRGLILRRFVIKQS